MKPVFLNIGCGFNQIESNENENWINVDAFDVCKPDIVHDLNEFPYPFEDDSIDGIFASHVMEHIDDWWGAFKECVRILKPGATIEIRVPHPSSDSAITYRDHLHVIDLRSFDGTMSGPERTTNAWFEHQDKVPAVLVSYQLNAWKQYWWMPNWLLAFCANHFRNFIWEQRITFEKVKL